jgi:hypothetical protein
VTGAHDRGSAIHGVDEAKRGGGVETIGGARTGPVGMGSWSFVWTPETNTSRAQEFLKLCTLVEQIVRNTLPFGSVV